jgi:hypothetical protein
MRIGSGAHDQYLVSTLNVSDGQVDPIETFLSEPSKIAAYAVTVIHPRRSLCARLIPLGGRACSRLWRHRLGA